MGSRHLGELVFRPAPLRPLLTPQISRAVLPRPLSQSPSTNRRSIHTGSNKQSRQSQTQTATAEPGSEENLPKPNPYSLFDTFESGRPQKSSDEVSSSIQNLFESGTSSKNSQPLSSSDEMRPPFNQARTANTNRQFGSNFLGKPRSQMKPSGQLRSTEWLEQMKTPDPVRQSSDTPTAAPIVLHEEKVIYPRLNASTGRSVQLDPARGKDIVKGLGLLGGLMARNKVRSDWFLQRFHERPGLKRKRLKGQRWRARFKKGFDATTARVSLLTRQGW